VLVAVVREEAEDAAPPPNPALWRRSRACSGSAFSFTDVGRLRTALRGSDPAQDEPALREELRLLRAEVEERHEHWPE